MSRFCSGGLALAALTLFATSASAQHASPGSLLVYPHIAADPHESHDSREGNGKATSVLSITNTSPTEEIRVHFIFVDGETCAKTNLYETLTPKDTFTAITNYWIPARGTGYIYAYAVNSSGQAIDFDHLIGSSETGDGYNASYLGMNTITFQGQTGHGNPTDLDADDNRDLDGLEYSAAPDRLMVPRFYGQPGYGGSPLGYTGSKVVLIGLSGTKFDTTVDLLIYNDNEEAFSSEVTFDCWDIRPLTSISGAFTQDFLHYATNQDPGEIVGLTNIESGWYEMNGAVASSTTTSIADPAFLAVHVSLIDLPVANLPFAIGEQTNGQLLSRTLSGS